MSLISYDMLTEQIGQGNIFPEVAAVMTSRRFIQVCIRMQIHKNTESNNNLQICILATGLSFCDSREK